MANVIETIYYYFSVVISGVIVYGMYTALKKWSSDPSSSSNDSDDCKKAQKIEGKFNYKYQHPFITSEHSRKKKKNKPVEHYITVHSAKRKKSSWTQPRKRGLVIGIDYLGTRNQLAGCINDASDVHRTIVEEYNYDETLLMTDKTELKPTRENICRALKWLCHEREEGEEVLYLHYSGHGGFVYGSKTEEDHKDETIVPLDFQTQEDIVDDDLHRMIVDPLIGSKRHLTAFFDCCHSGTGIDLKYQYEVKKGLFGRRTIRSKTAKQQYSSLSFHKNRSLPNVYFFSGCTDEQTSSDVAASEDVPSHGAFTKAYLSALQRDRTQRSEQRGKAPVTWREFLLDIHDGLDKGRFEQRPQFSASKSVDLSSHLYVG